MDPVTLATILIPVAVIVLFILIRMFRLERRLPLR